MNYSKFIASRIKDHKSNIVTKMWNIQQKLDDVIAMGRGDTDLDTPRHIIDAGIEALNNGATHYTHPMGMPELRKEICEDIIKHDGAKYNEDESCYSWWSRSYVCNCAWNFEFWR